jgi:uncharacterized protein (DUF2132 family)
MTLFTPLLDISMTEEINYKNNPLNGVGLKALLTEIVDYYGFEILYAYLNINCFKTNPSIASSIKFLKKTQWAREKIEAFYLYEFKNLPEPGFDQLSESPRARIIPDDQKPGEPAVLSLQDAEELRIEREQKAAEWGQREGRGSGAGKRSANHRGEHSDNRSKDLFTHDKRQSSKHSSASVEAGSDPWAKWKK